VRYACSPSGCVTACVVHTADSIRRFDSNEKKNDSQVPNNYVLRIQINSYETCCCTVRTTLDCNCHTAELVQGQCPRNPPVTGQGAENWKWRRTVFQRDLLSRTETSGCQIGRHRRRRRLDDSGEAGCTRRRRTAPNLRPKVRTWRRVSWRDTAAIGPRRTGSGRRRGRSRWSCPSTWRRRRQGLASAAFGSTRTPPPGRRRTAFRTELQKTTRTSLHLNRIFERLGENSCIFFFNAQLFEVFISTLILNIGLIITVSLSTVG